MCKVEGYKDLHSGECGHDTLAIHREKAIDSLRDKGPVCFPLFGRSRDAASGSEIKVVLQARVRQPAGTSADTRAGMGGRIRPACPGAGTSGSGADCQPARSQEILRLR